MGHELYRVHSRQRAGNAFNPGSGKPTRFAFFGDPTVPVLYAADTEAAAVCESLLHDLPRVCVLST
ncbi:RES domain-containing protein [Leifsonia psychrotolerans]|uniref:RES domain-containing protein n=1 Tax=Glaciibacter psychrotolerans TaxID=670054 RepID=UPI0015C7BBB1